MTCVCDVVSVSKISARVGMIIFLETSGKHQACPDDSARPIGDRQEVRPTSTETIHRHGVDVLPRSPRPGIPPPTPVGFLLRRVAPSLVSIQVWSRPSLHRLLDLPARPAGGFSVCSLLERWCSVQVKSERSPASKHVSAFPESGTTSLGTPKHSSEVSVLLR